MNKIIINGFFRIAMFAAIAALTACGGGDSGGGKTPGGDKPPGDDGAKVITASSSSGLSLSAPGSSTAKLSGALGGADSTNLTFTAAATVKEDVTVTIAGNDDTLAALSAANCKISTGKTSCNVTLTAVKDGSVTLSYAADNGYTVSPSPVTFKISSGSVTPVPGPGPSGDWVLVPKGQKSLVEVGGSTYSRDTLRGSTELGYVCDSRNQGEKYLNPTTVSNYLSQISNGAVKLGGQNYYAGFGHGMAPSTACGQCVAIKVKRTDGSYNYAVIMRVDNEMGASGDVGDDVIASMIDGTSYKQADRMPYEYNNKPFTCPGN